MSDDEWAKLYQEYVYVKAVEFKNLASIIELSNKKALIEVVNAIFKSVKGV